jgi:hypothetical protein
MKSAQAGVVNVFRRPLQARSNHRFGGVPMRGAHALTQTVVQGVIEVEDGAADEWSLGCGRRSPAFPALS